MKNIFLKKISLSNFKGIKSKVIDFTNQITDIAGPNGSGKTSIFDAFTWVLFGKDSHDRKDFEIKTLQEDGTPISKTEHTVEAVLSVDGNGIKIASIGSQGIMFTGYIPESYTKRNFRKLNTTNFTESAISTELVASIMQKFNTGKYPQGATTENTQIIYDIGLNTNTPTYEYYEGRNFESADNSQYAGFYTTANKFGNKLADGIYLKQNIIVDYTQISSGHSNVNFWCEAYLIQNGKIASGMEILKSINIYDIPVRNTAFPTEDYE